MTPTSTTAVAITAGMLSGLIVWLCKLTHIDPPPMDVAMTMGALTLGAAHGAAKGIQWWINRRWPDRQAVKATATPASPP